MSTRIVCTEQTGCTSYGHIVAVGVSNTGDLATKRMTVNEVWLAMDSGEYFYTYGGDKVASVEKYYCGCGRGSLRSKADSTTANNLDSLRLCQWKAA